MKPIPEIVKDHVIKNCGRMPESDKEIDQYLDLINHAREYGKAVILEKSVGVKMLKRLGIKTVSDVKKEGDKLFNK